MFTNPRSIIFVPGSFHTTWYYHILISKLQASKYPGRIIEVQLPSNGGTPGSPATQSMRPDVEAVEAALSEEIVKRHNPVLLIGHSYGSVVSGCAIEKFADSGMIRFLNMAGMMYKKGECVFSYCPEAGSPPPFYTVFENGFVLSDESVLTMYNGVSEDLREEVISRRLRQPIGPNVSPVTFEGWAAVPTTYFVCSEDQVIPPIAQDLYIANAKERNANVKVVSLPTGHSPMLSMPNETLDIIQQHLD